jgi:hypothetical protein
MALARGHDVFCLLGTDGVDCRHIYLVQRAMRALGLGDAMHGIVMKALTVSVFGSLYGMLTRELSGQAVHMMTLLGLTQQWPKSRLLCCRRPTFPTQCTVPANMRQQQWWLAGKGIASTW